MQCFWLFQFCRLILEWLIAIFSAVSQNLHLRKYTCWSSIALAFAAALCTSFSKCETHPPLDLSSSNLAKIHQPEPSQLARWGDFSSQSAVNYILAHQKPLLLGDKNDFPTRVDFSTTNNDRWRTVVQVRNIMAKNTHPQYFTISVYEQSGEHDLALQTLFS